MHPWIAGNFKQNIPLILLIFFILGLVQPNFGWKTYKPEIYTTKTPQQTVIPDPEVIFHKKTKILPLARFDLEARVLSKHRYVWGEGAKLSPYDFAFGWGAMANRRNVQKIRIFQFKRWYQYFYKEPPLPVGEIAAQSANMHLIPASKEVRKKMKKARRGHIVRLKGQLVNVTMSDGGPWNTSLSRTDTGGGACEIVWVEEFDIL